MTTQQSRPSWRTQAAGNALEDTISLPVQPCRCSCHDDAGRLFVETARRPRRRRPSEDRRRYLANLLVSYGAPVEVAAAVFGLPLRKGVAS